MMIIESNHIPAWESPYKTMRCFPLGSPKVQDGIDVTPYAGQHSPAGPPQSSFVLARDGVRSLGSDLMDGAFATRALTSARALDGGPALAVGSGTVAGPAWAASSTDESPNDRAMSRTPRPTGAHGPGSGRRAWRTGFSTSRKVTIETARATASHTRFWRKGRASLPAASAARIRIGQCQR